MRYIAAVIALSTLVVAAQDLPQPKIIGVCPQQGPVEQQFDVLIVGEGFTDAVASIDGSAVPTTILNDSLCKAECPRLGAGPHSLSISNASGSVSSQIVIEQVLTPIALVACMSEALTAALNVRLITSAGVENSLQAKLSACTGSLIDGRFPVAVNQLGSLTNELSAQSGRAVNDQFAGALINFTDTTLIPLIQEQPAQPDPIGGWEMTFPTRLGRVRVTHPGRDNPNTQGVDERNTVTATWVDAADRPLPGCPPINFTLSRRVRFHRGARDITLEAYDVAVQDADFPGAAEAGLRTDFWGEGKIIVTDPATDSRFMQVITQHRSEAFNAAGGRVGGRQLDGEHRDGGTAVSYSTVRVDRGGVAPTGTLGLSGTIGVFFDIAGIGSVRLNAQGVFRITANPDLDTPAGGRFTQSRVFDAYILDGDAPIAVVEWGPTMEFRFPAAGTTGSVTLSTFAVRTVDANAIATPPGAIPTITQQDVDRVNLHLGPDRPVIFDPARHLVTF